MYLYVHVHVHVEAELHVHVHVYVALKACMFVRACTCMYIPFSSSKIQGIRGGRSWLDRTSGHINASKFYLFPQFLDQRITQ